MTTLNSSYVKTRSGKWFWDRVLFAALTWWWAIVLVAYDRLFVGDQEDRLGPGIAIEYLFFFLVGALCIAEAALLAVFFPPLSLGELVPAAAAQEIPAIVQLVPARAVAVFLGWVQYAGFGCWFLLSLRKWGGSMP